MAEGSTGDCSTSVAKVVQLVARLRDSQSGCRWDKQQSWSSLQKYTREEVAELIEAIDSNNPGEVCEELGDLLFHLVLYSRIAEEQGMFTFADVAERLCAKMLERHPHVFPDGRLDGQRVPTQEQPSIEQLRMSWQQIKDRQKANKPDVISSNK